MTTLARRRPARRLRVLAEFLTVLLAVVICAAGLFAVAYIVGATAGTP
jgi:hypothetical protein